METPFLGALSPILLYRDNASYLKTGQPAQHSLDIHVSYYVSYILYETQLLTPVFLTDQRRLCLTIQGL